MAESVFLKPISFAFAIVTFIESIIWTILSFLAILCYNDIITYESGSNYGLKSFVANLHELYLSGKTYSKGRAVTQEVFYTLMWFYFLLSLFLCFASGTHIAVLTQKSNIRKINLSTIIWQSLTYIVCLFDFITCILFGVDYHLVRQSKTSEESLSEAIFEIKLAVIITMIVLSAKGFILWIINVVFSVIITVLFRQKVKINDEPILRIGPEIHARNYSAYSAYGDVDIDDKNMEVNNNNIENNSSRPEEEQSTEPYASVNNSTWFTKLSVENSRRSFTSGLSDRASSPSYDPLDDILSTNNNWSTIPRASSFRQPRSLAASLAPSPVPPPSKETPSGRRSAPPDMWDKDRRNDEYSSGYRTEDDNRTEENEYDDVDDVSESMSKMRRVFPNHRRFNLDEPDPDYEHKL